MWYTSGLPFDTTLAENLSELMLRVSNKKASMVIIDGLMGEGKTTLAVHVADYFNGAYVKIGEKKYQYIPERVIDLKKQYAMGGSQFIENVQICIDSKHPVSMYDEGGDFNKRGSLTAFNMQLNRIFDTYRAFQFVPIICLPNAGVVDRELYVKGVPRMIIHCEKRTATEGSYRVYGLWRFMWVLQKMQKAPVPQQAYMKTRPNFYGHFLDLPEARRKELELISTQGKKDIITNNVLKNRGLISVGDMAKRLSISKPHLNRLIRDNALKPESEYKKVRYFNTHTVNLISEQIKRK